MSLREQLSKIIRGVQDVDLAVDLVISMVRAEDATVTAQLRAEAAAIGWEKRRRKTPANGVPSDGCTSAHMGPDGCTSAHEHPFQLPAVVLSGSDPDLIRIPDPEPDYCAEPNPADPVVLTFPTVGKAKEWVARASFVATCRDVYPGLNIEAELKRAQFWCANNPGKRKTPRGMPKFVQNWLEAAQNRGNGARASPASAQQALITAPPDWPKAPRL